MRLDFNLSPDAGWEERLEDFDAWFDMDVDPCVGLSVVVEKAGSLLAQVFGEPAVDLHFGALAGLSQQYPTWRETVGESDNYLEWPLGQRMYGLLGYAVFGLAGLDVCGRPASREDIEAAIRSLGVLLQTSGVDLWLSDEGEQVLSDLYLMAAGRAALDAGEPVEPRALALLGDVKMSRIMNMISGADPELPRDVNGLVLNHSALGWLSKRPSFLKTLFGGGLSQKSGSDDLIDDPVFVPVSKDGSVFNPSCRREAGYQIGPKGDEEYYSSFEEALTALQQAQVARWRRPNANGNWGIVVAVEWRRVSKKVLHRMPPGL